MFVAGGSGALCGHSFPPERRYGFSVDVQSFSTTTCHTDTQSLHTSLLEVQLSQLPKIVQRVVSTNCQSPYFTPGGSIFSHTSVCPAVREPATVSLSVSDWLCAQGAIHCRRERRVDAGQKCILDKEHDMLCKCLFNQGR